MNSAPSATSAIAMFVMSFLFGAAFASPASAPGAASLARALRGAFGASARSALLPAEGRELGPPRGARELLCALDVFADDARASLDGDFGSGRASLSSLAGPPFTRLAAAL